MKKSQNWAILILGSFFFLNVIVLCGQDNAVPIADGFDYPVGNRGYLGNIPVPIWERISGGDFAGETNTLFPNNLGFNEYNTRYIASGTERCPWYNGQDLGSFYDARNGYHPGEDWNRSGDDDVGENVFSIANGEIVYKRELGSVGWFVGVKHLYKGLVYISVYGHVEGVNFEEGDVIFRNDTIGRIGDFFGDFSHLHFELRQTGNFNSSDLYPSDNGQGYYTSLENLEEDGFVIDPSDFIDQNRPQPINHGTDLIIGQNTTALSIKLGTPVGEPGFSFASPQLTHVTIGSESRPISNYSFSNSEITFDIPINYLDFLDSPADYQIERISIGIQDGQESIYYAGKVKFVGQFSDVADDRNVFYDYVYNGVDLELFGGYPSGVFGLEANTGLDKLTKGAAAKVLVTTAYKLGLITEMITSVPNVNLYSDVGPCNEFYPYIQTLGLELERKGIYILPFPDGQNSFGVDDPITIGTFSLWLDALLGIEPNDQGITGGQRITGVDLSLISNVLERISMQNLARAFVLNDQNDIESILNFSTNASVNNNTLLTRGMMAKALVNAYRYKSQQAGNIRPGEVILQLRSGSSGPFQEYTVIGDKTEFIINGGGVNPPVDVVEKTYNIAAGATLDFETDINTDPYGQSYQFYWTVDGGTLTPLNGNIFNQVRFTAP